MRLKKIGTIEKIVEFESDGKVAIYTIKNGTGIYNRYDISLEGRTAPKKGNKKTWTYISSNLRDAIVKNYLEMYPNSMMLTEFVKKQKEKKI